MVLDVEQLPDCTLVALVGHLTGIVTARIYDQLIPQLQTKHPRVVLDLAGVTYLSSAALRLLLSLYRVIDGRSGIMVLAGMTDEVNDILSITGFGDLFRTYKDRTTALAMLR